jgi:hypothetical protein
VVELPGHKRGCHVITSKVLQQLPELNDVDIGLANFFSAPPWWSCSARLVRHSLNSAEAPARRAMQSCTHPPA